MNNQNIASAAEKATWRDFLEITKPRIIRTNLIATFGGFWLASQWNIDWWLLVQVLLGSTLVMACACVFNNYLDRDLDQKMARTQHRPLASGKLKPQVVFWYGLILGIAGQALLFQINILSGVLGLIGVFVYIVVYTMWLKRTSTWSTSVGGISGAMPPVIGYCAYSGVMDPAAWFLFLLLFLWQPPHFWALGIRRKEEYRAAGFPLLPVVKGVKRTKLQMLPYIILIIPASILLYVYDYVGIIYLICALIMGVLWLAHSISGIRAKDNEAWAKKNFMYSIYYLTIIFLVMIIDTVHV